MTVKDLLSSLTEEQQNTIKAQLRLDADMRSEEIEGYAYALSYDIKDMYLPRLKLHCGQFDTLFNSAEDFEEYHNNWLRMNSRNWGRYFRTVVVKYNIIHNTDKTQEETTTTTNTGEGFSTSNGSSSGSSSNKHTADNSSSGTSSGTTKKDSSGSALHQLSAANQTDFHNKHKDTTESTESGTVTENSSGTDKRNETDAGSSTTSSEQEQSYNNESTTEVVHKIRAYGNIGVTTNQQMLAEERRHLAFDMLDHIIGDFKKEFCIMVY